MTDFNSEAAAHRGRQLYAARLKATAQLAEAEADNNVEYAAEQIQTIANIDQEGEASQAVSVIACEVARSGRLD
jgi:hypothetical protein